MDNTVFWVAALLSLFFAAILFKKYTDKQLSLNQLVDTNNYSAIQKYLLNENQLDELGASAKPIMWIHIPLEYNARRWQSFGSRSSYDLNQPYLYLTVQSILQQCDESFRICMIDDASFHKLLPGMDIDLGKVADPMLGYIRQMLLANLVYKYGGMVTPISFLCFQDLIGLYEKGLRTHSLFVCENVNSNVTAANFDFCPDARFMGGEKGSSACRELMDFMQRQISSDYTAQPNFLGDFDRWLKNKSNSGSVQIISGTEVGTKTVNDGPVLVDTLLGSDTTILNFYGRAYGVWIPAADILKRTRYQWFARMSLEQVMKSNTVIGNYILLAVSPDKRVVTEALTAANCNDIDAENEEKKPDWISFWKTPSGINVWGPKPQFLGNTVPRATN
jgi:hypothetical protein